MIKVEVVEADGLISSLSISGHADAAPRGEDLVCAGVSSCFVGALNALDEPNRCEIASAGGLGRIRVCEPLSTHDQTVLEVVTKQLQCIADSYPHHVIVKIQKEGIK